MAIIISTQGDCAFRSSDVESIFHVRDKETNELTNKVSIYFKSGNQGKMIFKDVDEAKGFINTVIREMKNA